MIDAFQAGELDAVYIAYTRFINTMKQEPVMEQLLPLTGERSVRPRHGWDYLYEPDAQVVIDELLVRYVEALVYQSVAENMASEQSARMVAMKAASDNAGNVIGELQLVYNKTRQAAITKELSEIVGGAARSDAGLTTFIVWGNDDESRNDRSVHRRRGGHPVPARPMPKVYDALTLDGRGCRTD
jgi:F-type H+-transporting ATPase subunit gamma